MADTIFRFRLSFMQCVVPLISVLVVILPILPSFAGGLPALAEVWSTVQPGAFVTMGIIVVGAETLAWGLLYFLFASAPKGALITSAGLHILRRRRSSVFVPASEVLALERIGHKTLRWSIRGYGCDGFLGTWGYFSNKTLGSYQAFLTNSKSLVLIRTVTKGLFVISPDHPDEFIACATKAFDVPAQKPAQA